MRRQLRRLEKTKAKRALASTRSSSDISASDTDFDYSDESEAEFTDSDPDAHLEMRGRPRKHPTPVLDPCAPVRMRGRPRKHPENHSPERPLTKSHAPARKRGRPRKHPKTFSPAPAPGLGAPVRKRGRPRKYPGLDRKDRFEAAVEPQDQPFIHFRPEDGVAVQARKRGRPRKHPVREVTGQELAHHMRSNTTVPEAFVITGSVEKTRTELEPRRISSKATLHAVTGLAPGEFVWALDGVSASTGTKRKRGRPPRRRQFEQIVCAASEDLHKTNYVIPSRSLSTNEQYHDTAGDLEAPAFVAFEDRASATGGTSNLVVNHSGCLAAEPFGLNNPAHVMTPLSNDIGVESTDAMSLGNLGDDLEKACVEQNTQQMIHSSVDEARLPDAAKDAGVSISRNDFLSELSSFPTATTTTLSIHAAAATHSPGSTHETSDQATSSYLPTTRHTIARPGNNLPVPPSSETDARESFLNGLQDLSSLLGRVFGGPTPTTVSTPTAEASTSALHSILMNVNPLKDPLPPSLMERDEFEHAHVELSDVTTSASVIPLAGTLPVSEEMFNPEITNASSELTSTTTAAESIFRSRRVPMVDVPFSHKDNMRLVEYIVDHTDVNEQHDFIEFYEIMVRQVDIVKYTWVQRHFPSAWHQHYTCYQRQFDHAETLLRCANHLEEMWAYKRKYGYSIVARPIEDKDRYWMYLRCNIASTEDDDDGSDGVESLD